MKIVVEANSIDELVELLERLLSPKPVITCAGEKPSSISIDSLGITVRSLNILKDSGIQSVGQLARMSDYELLRLPHLGKHSLREIRAALKEHGFS